MKKITFKPKTDKFFLATLISIAVIMLALTVLSAFYPISLIFSLPIDFIVFYMLISPLFGYVELREKTVFIKFGLVMKKEIPYRKIRGAEKDRKFYSESMLALKNAVEHVNIRYNTFDVVTVSVENNDVLIEELKKRAAPLNKT